MYLCFHLSHLMSEISILPDNFDHKVQKYFAKSKKKNRKGIVRYNKYKISGQHFLKIMFVGMRYRVSKKRDDRSNTPY